MTSTTQYLIDTKGNRLMACDYEVAALVLKGKARYAGKQINYADVYELVDLTVPEAKSLLVAAALS